MLELPKKKHQVILYLVDANELDSKILEQKFMLSSDYEIFPFYSGEKFLTYLISNPAQKSTISIVILDYHVNSSNIEAKNGIEILKSIKDIDPEIEVIMLSSREDVDIVTSSIHGP
ncbi:MAG: response regulator [Bacteroidia bacterium]|nr:response regulator [Bacteroidia bacterium]